MDTEYLSGIDESLLAHKTNASNAFVVAYLLGTKEETLDANFFHDYKMAEDLGFFSDDKTYYLHLLVRVRGHILRNYMVLGKNSHNELEKYVYGRDVENLKREGFNLYTEAKKYEDISGVLALLCTTIDSLVLDVLTKWEVMAPEVMKKLFMFVDPDDWGSLGEEAVYFTTRNNDFCYNRYVAYHRDMGTSRPRLFFDDDTLYKTAMKATGMKAKYKDLDSTLWEKVYAKLKAEKGIIETNTSLNKVMVEAVIKDKEEVEKEKDTVSTEVVDTETTSVNDNNTFVSVEVETKIDSNNIVNDTEVTIKEKEGEAMSGWKATLEPLPLDFEMPERKKKEVRTKVTRQPLITDSEGLLGFSPTDTVTFYVDCDNVDVLTMLEFFSQLATEGKANRYKVKLFTDDMTTYGWKYLNKSVLKGIETNIIQTERIRSEKSAVDVVLAGHFIRDSIEDSSLRQVIVSSDSDYFGLATMGYNFAVLYQDDFVSMRYLQKLYKMGIKHKDLTEFKPDTLSTTYKTALLRVIVSQVLLHTPIADWGDTAMIEEFISSELYKMDAKEVFSDFIVNSSVIEKWISDAKVEFVDGKFTVVI